MTKQIGFLIITVIVFFMACRANAGNLGVGVHSGYGVIDFKEEENYTGTDLESESRQEVILFGISGEYSFQRLKNFYASVITDWTFGLGNKETWRQDDARIRTNDIEIFGQFYDARFGYKNSHDKFYYRIYVSGGWDGLSIKRDNWDPVTDRITEDISLWRTGVGTGVSYKTGKWALDGRVAYSYYPEGKTEDSSLPQYTFDTDGTCFDAGLGIARDIAENMSFYLGGSYTLQKLKGSTTDEDISWKSRLEILAVMGNLTYAF